VGWGVTCAQERESAQGKTDKTSKNSLERRAQPGRLDGVDPKGDKYGVMIRQRFEGVGAAA